MSDRINRRRRDGGDSPESCLLSGAIIDLEFQVEEALITNKHVWMGGGISRCPEKCFDKIRMIACRELEDRIDRELEFLALLSGQKNPIMPELNSMVIVMVFTGLLELPPRID